jgi:hypothetical protein
MCGRAATLSVIKAIRLSQPDLGTAVAEFGCQWLSCCVQNSAAWYRSSRVGNRAAVLVVKVLVGHSDKVTDVAR